MTASQPDFRSERAADAALPDDAALEDDAVVEPGPSPRPEDEPVSRTVIGTSEDLRSEEPAAADSLGGWLPSRPQSLQAARGAGIDPLALEPGGRIGEFVVERVLGRGGFGVVYLARQLSLDRQVALKVSCTATLAAVDGEGRSLARLEHENIVQVFAEMIDPVSGAQLLCMQYVAGTTLAAVIRALNQASYGRSGWIGADLIAVLDALPLPPALFDPLAMRDRELLIGADHIEAVCRLGEQLARALAHAHGRGVLHRDVKPANVLLGRYGRPHLADFNLAHRETEDVRSDVVGGTLAYMAPEHLEAFNSEDTTTAEAIDARCDVYSLAVLLWELSTGKLPFSAGETVERDQLSAMLKSLACERRQWRPDFLSGDTRLHRVLSRGMAPDPTKRYASAEEFADTLAGLREQRTALRLLPRPDAVTRRAWNHPVQALILCAILPQLVGSALQVSYNLSRITLTDQQATLFVPVALVYNVIAYPSCLAWLTGRLMRVVRVWKELRRGEPLDAATVELARRRALRLPRDTAVAATVGWLPGAVLFPLALQLGAGPVPAETWAHFVISFGLAWLIAATYSYFFVLGTVLRTMYLRFWIDPRRFHERARVELAPVPDRLRAVNVMAGIIPLTAAATMVLIAPNGTGDSDDYNAFRFLTVSLIAVGMAGYVFVGRRSRRYLEVINACIGGESRSDRLR